MAFSLRLAPFLPASDSSATHTGSSASSSLAHSLIHAMCTGRGLIAGVARARLPYTECPVSRVWDPHARGGISQCVLGPCLRAGCIHAALVVCGSRRDALGAGRRCLAPQVGGDSWSSCSGLGGAQLGGVRATQGITPGTVRTVLANPGVECSPDLPRGLRRVSESAPISRRRVGRHRQTLKVQPSHPRGGLDL